MGEPDPKRFPHFAAIMAVFDDASDLLLWYADRETSRDKALVDAIDRRIDRLIVLRNAMEKKE